MPTIPRMLASFELALRAERRSRFTITSYRESVEQLAGWLAERDARDDHDVAEVTREDVRGFLVHLGDLGRTDATRRTRYGGLRQFFGWLVAEGELDASPVDRVKPPKAIPPRIDVLAETQIRALLNTCGRDFAGVRDAAIIRLLADTGMRSGELLGLTVEEVDVPGRVAFVMGKGSRPRAVPFGYATAKALDTYLRHRERHEMARRTEFWLGQRGPLLRNGLRQILLRRGRDAGVDGVHPHRFRHSFADSWLRNGGQEGDLMRLAGWTSRQMLDRYGASAATSRAREAHDRLALGDRL